MDGNADDPELGIRLIEDILPVATLFCRRPGCFNRDMPIDLPTEQMIVCCCGHPITETYPIRPPATPGASS